MKKVLCLLLIIGSSFANSPQPLRVVTEELPPYQIVVDGQLVSGTSFLLVQELLACGEFKSRIELLPWARAFSIASTETNVIIFSIARGPEREPHFHWLYKLASLDYHFYALSTRQDLAINALSEIFTHTIATVRGSFEANSLLRMGFVEDQNLILTLNYKDAWQMVMIGRADFTYASQLIEDVIFEPQSGEPARFTKSFNLGETSDLYVAASINTDESILDKLKSCSQLMQQEDNKPLSRHAATLPLVSLQEAILPK